MLRKLVMIMVYGFGGLGILTSIFFYTQPNDIGTFLKTNAAGLYDFFLYYFIISGGVSFVIVAVGGCMIFAKKTSFCNMRLGLLVNVVALSLYLLFSFLN